MRQLLVIFTFAAAIAFPAFADNITVYKAVCDDGHDRIELGDETLDPELALDECRRHVVAVHDGASGDICHVAEILLPISGDTSGGFSDPGEPATGARSTP